MKILYGHQIFTRQVYGGVSRYIHEISRRIPALQGDSTEIFAPLHVNAYLQDNPSLLPPARRLRKFRGGAAVLGAIDIGIGMLRIRPRKDVSIFHPSYYPLLDYRPKGSRLVVTVYDMIHELEPSSFARHDPTIRLKRKSVKNADHVICISENTRRELIDITGIDRIKTSVIHLGHSLADDITPTNLPLENRKPLILYVGNRTGYKNFNLLLQAFAKSAELRRNYTIVCFGGGAFSPAELSLLQSYGLSSNVQQANGGDEELSRLYSTASLLVYPSKREGFGIPPLEAMAHGCPVVCTNSSSLPEVCGNAADYFACDDPDDLREKIERVLRDASHAQCMVARGLTRTRLFSWDQCAAQTLALYQQLEGASPK